MTISRRQFCGAIGAGLAMANADLSADDSKPKPLRVIAYNIFKLTGWPHQRHLARQAVAEGQMAKRLAMELALHDPDIFNFSESPSEQLAKEVAELLGMNHVRFPSGGNWPGTLLSKFEITESQNAPMKGKRPKELFTRHWGRATFKLTNDDPLIVHSVHLYPTADPTVRLREIRAMIESMKPDLDAGRSMLLMGDLNHVSDTNEYKLWIDAGWVDTFAKVGKGDGPTIKSDIPQWRIDYVMAAGPIAERVVESRPLLAGAKRVTSSESQELITVAHVHRMCEIEQIDHLGLDAVEKQYLHILRDGQQADDDQDLIQLWLANRPKNTVRAYLRDVNRLLDFTERSLHQTRLGDLQDFAFSLEATLGPKNGVHFKPHGAACPFTRCTYGISHCLRSPVA